MISGVKCDIIIPVFDRLDLTKNCLQSIYDRTHVPFSLIVVDNCSGSETERFLKDFRSSHDNFILIRNDSNLGWVKAVNQGIKLSKSPFLCIMNNDTIVRTDNWLSKLIDVANSDPAIGLINPYFKAKDRSVYRAAYIEVDFCRGYCIMLKRDVVDKIGLLDESYGLGYYDDDDYSVRAIRGGFRCIRANGVFVEHLGDSTFSDIFKNKERLELHEANKKLFYSRWGKRLRILLAIKKYSDRKAVSETLFSIARKQHIIFVFNSGKPLRLQHINIRERLLPPFLFSTILSGAICCNLMKKREKRYDAVFACDKSLNSIRKLAGHTIHYVNISNEGDKVLQIVDSLAKA